MNLLDLMTCLTPCVLEAGEKIMDVYYKDPKQELKNDGSPVTEADRASEKIILSSLKKLTPDVLIISEENSDSHFNPAEKNFFLVDPLDGTKEFLKKDGKGSFTVNIGLIKNNVPIMGIVYAPALNQIFFGAKNLGAWQIINGKRTKMSIRTIKRDKTVAVVSASHKDIETTEWLKKQQITKTKSIGSSLKFCLIASGQADVYPRFGPTMEWDTAAGDAILRAAGGTVTNADFSKFYYGKHLYKNGPFIAWGDKNIKEVA